MRQNNELGRYYISVCVNGRRTISERVDGIITEEMNELIASMIDTGSQLTEAIGELTEEQKDTVEVQLLGDMLIAFASAMNAITALGAMP